MAVRLLALQPTRGGAVRVRVCAKIAAHIADRSDGAVRCPYDLIQTYGKTGGEANGVFRDRIKRELKALADEHAGQIDQITPALPSQFDNLAGTDL